MREYARVLRGSVNRQALTLAHATPLTRADATALVALAADVYSIEPPTVRWGTWRSNGRYCPTAHRVTLPSEPDAGIVLHEVAHAVQYRGNVGESDGNHGVVFTGILDTLVEATHGLW